MRPFAHRRRDTVQAERLDQYCRSLAAGEDAPPADLDADVAALAQRLCGSLTSISPRPAFVAALGRRIDEEASRRAKRRHTSHDPSPAKAPAPEYGEPAECTLRRSIADAVGGVAWLLPATLLVILTVIAARPIVDRLSGRSPATRPSPTTGTASTPTAVAAAKPALDGSEWVLEAIAGRAPLQGPTITLAVKGGDASGFAGCNHYGARGYFGDDGTILVSDMVTVTLRLCDEPEGVMEMEAAFIAALQEARRYSLDGEHLSLSDDAGHALLTFRRRTVLPMDPANLIGTTWLLQSLAGEEPLAGTRITLSFAEAEVSGSAGCRDYVATYVANGDTLQFPLLEMKDTSCTLTDELLLQEGRFTDALGLVHYSLTADRLELYTESGQTLVFVPLPAAQATAIP